VPSQSLTIEQVLTLLAETPPCLAARRSNVALTACRISVRVPYGSYSGSTGPYTGANSGPAGM
jgi:hypothetical protein